MSDSPLDRNEPNSWFQDMHLGTVQSQCVDSSGHTGRWGKRAVRPLQKRDSDSLSHPPHCQPPYCEVQHSAGNIHASDSSFKPRCLVEVMVSFSQEKKERKKKQCLSFPEEIDSVRGDWQPQGSPQSCSVSDPLLWKVLRWLGEDVKAYGKGGAAKNHPSQWVIHVYCSRSKRLNFISNGRNRPSL